MKWGIIGKYHKNINLCRYISNIFLSAVLKVNLKSEAFHGGERTYRNGSHYTSYTKISYWTVLYLVYGLMVDYCAYTVRLVRKGTT